MAEKAKIKLLIVDDDKIYREELRDSIMSGFSNFEVELAGSGLEAKRAINKGGIQVVLTDMAMPDINGCDLYLWIKGTYPEICVIMVSAYLYDPTHTVHRAKLNGLKEVIPNVELVGKNEMIEILYGKIKKYFPDA